MLAAQLQDKGIMVNACCPGSVQFFWLLVLVLVSVLVLLQCKGVAFDQAAGCRAYRASGQRRPWLSESCLTVCCTQVWCSTCCWLHVQVLRHRHVQLAGDAVCSSRGRHARVAGAHAARGLQDGRLLEGQAAAGVLRLVPNIDGLTSGIWSC